MFTNRISKIAVVLLVLAVAFITVSFVTRPANAPTANRSYDVVEQIRASRSVFESSSSAREYQLGERYGELPQDLAKAKAAREYWLGERYGVTPQGYAQQQALREYWLGERYGQTP